MKTVAAESGLRALVTKAWLAVAFIFLLITSSSVYAGAFCSDAPFNGVIDGSDPIDLAALGTQITIDTDCTFQNFPASNPLTVTLNFQTNDPSIYLITFNNVVFTGNMACANINHRIWFVNGSDYGTKNNCQDLFIPVEAINKLNPPGVTTVGIGDPFTYTLRIPVLYDPVTGTYINNAGSANDLHTITIKDNLNTTGAALTLVGTPTVTWVGSGAPVTHTFSNSSGDLTFAIDPSVIIPAGDQIEIAITAVADASNTPGTQFVNTATWTFGRLIDIDGVPTFFDPLPGENGVTDPLTIGGPTLIVTKSSPDTAMNLVTSSTFTIDVENTGGARAWDATIVDQLPDTATAGMCDNDPTASVTAEVLASDNSSVSGPLIKGTDYTVAYAGPATCQLTFTLLTANASIGPSEHLHITYQTKLDSDTTADGATLTNVAAATQWFSGDGSYPRATYTGVLTDGTPGVTDNQDSHTMTTALTGYIFQKTVSNISTGVSPASIAAPGDTLRYRLRLFNFSYTINSLSISDTLDGTRLDRSSFTMVTPPGSGATYTYNSTSGLLTITGNPPPLNLVPPQEIMLEFDVKVLSTLTTGTIVSNQASFSALDEFSTPFGDTSDDPYVNGISGPGDPTDATQVTIQAPGPLSKTTSTTTATIGQQFTYTITVPATPINTPLYDVRILDNLAASAANMQFVSASVVSGGSWTLSNTGTSTNVIIQDLSTGIDIPANGQAVIQLTVQLSNTLTNQLGLAFKNSASYTYNRVNGDSNTQTSVAAGTSNNVSIVEPAISSISKTVNNSTPSPGDTIRYSVTLTANGSAGHSDVFDVILTDTLPLGLVYAGNPTVTVGAGVGAGNTINAPDITGDGVTTAQTLVWGVIEADIDIQAGDTVTVAYDVLVDSTAYYNRTFNNSVVAQWSSIDGSSGAERDGSDGVGGLNDYVTSPATTSITTPPEKLNKQNTQTTAAVGDRFRYRITVPEHPQSDPLYDVVITDDLTASAADMTFVSVTKVSGSQTFTPVNVGTSTNLIIKDSTNGIDIPAGEQIVIDITVELSDTVTNVSGLTFQNTATYTYNQTNNTPATVKSGYPGTTGNMTIIGPDNLTLQKSGPATMQIGTPATFTLNVKNIGTSPAYDLTIQDKIPNPTPGGMCDVAPANITAQLYLDDAVTTVGAALVQNTDFTATVVPGTPSCILTFTMLTPAAAIPPNDRLIIHYDLSLDLDTPNATALTNIAGAIQWFSGNTAGTGATGSIRTYTRTISDGTTAVLDHEDAYTVLSDVPVITLQKYVSNVTTGQNPGDNASPGDTLHYKIIATNTSAIAVPSFSIRDDLDHLNSPADFAPGSLRNIIAPATADISNSNANGGTKGSGLLDVRNISLDAAGGANDSVTIEFDVTLVSVIDSGTLVKNQATLQLYNLTPVLSDDPNIGGTADPNQTLIASAPAFQINKISDDITGLATELMPGDTLRYTITVKNIGNENAVNATLRDSIPTYTRYVPGTTTLNGIPVVDPAAGVSAIESGMLINAPAPEDTTPGHLRADASSTTANVATITFNVQVSPTALEGTIIANQGYLNADGAGSSGPVPQQPSDDPNTAVVNDPTRDIVGNLPLVDAQKTVALYTDINSNGIVDPGDTLRYTITVTNYGAKQATGVILTDSVPANTTYVTNSVYLDGNPVGQPDGGVSPLIAGIPIPGGGILLPGATTTITFDVTVDLTTPTGTIISNQGYVSDNELPTEPTDADGIDSNGDQPTLIAVGNGQYLSITKTVAVVGGGAALPNGQLEYVIQVTNVGTVPATDVEILDDLTPVASQMTYVAGTATLNGLTKGVAYTPTTFTVDYGTAYGMLQPGQTAEFRFRVLLDAGLLMGDTVTNTGTVYWNTLTQSATATVSIDIGAIPGVANLNGNVWHDANFDDVLDSGERRLENWSVGVYFKGNLLGTVLTDVNGEYHVMGLTPNYYTSDRYELRFVGRGATSNSAKLGMATSVYSNDLQRIYNIITYPNTNVQNLNLPIDPDGVIYNSLVRTPLAGATVTLLNASTNSALPSSCFADPAQQNQLTAFEGYYKFDINFSQPECPNNANYIIAVTPPSVGYINSESVFIPATTDAATAPFSVPNCLAFGVDDAVPSTANYCEVTTSELQPPLSVPPGSAGTKYHLHLTLNNSIVPGESQLFNNHIPVDPDLAQVVTITKTTPLVNVSRGDLVPYTITVVNTLPIALTDMTLIDTIPAGFKYVKGSARLNKVPTEPVWNNLQLTWDMPSIDVNTTYTLEMLLIVGGGVHEGEYVNRARVQSNLNPINRSIEAAATVRVVPDPMFDCTDVIGKVFDDLNFNGYQDENEPGIAGVRLATARGLLVTTDKQGRFHVTCAAVPNEDRGSNFILKLDERSLPVGYRVTTDNPRVERVTRGKMARFNFGATVHHVVTLGVADGVFKSKSTTIRPQWLPRLGLLMEELRKKTSVLRITYLADVESSGLVNDRIAALKAAIQERWSQVSDLDLVIEKEVYWRHGGPVDDDFNISGKSTDDYISMALANDNFGEDTERQLPFGYTYMPWIQDPEQFNKNDQAKFETKQVAEKKFTTRKLEGLVPPILFKSGKADISQEYVDKLREILNSMRDRVNVRLHFVGHTDNVKLQGNLKRQYEDNLGLSKERAGTTAEFFQRALLLPPEAISYEGMGDTKPVASNNSEAGRAKNRRVEVEVWYDEVSEAMVDKKVEVDQQVKRVMVCRVETVCMLRYKEGHSRRAKLRNLVPPFHYDDGVSEISSQYLQQLQQALHNLASKDNVQMRFIAYTDNIPLTGRDERIYGDHVGLSKANARRVALAVQEALKLPNAAVDSNGKGSENPVASNNSEKGRALNRRIEVEFWYDDPLEDLPDEPQICPEASAAETVERIYNPPEGDIKPIYFENGQPVIPDGYTKALQRAMEDVKDKGNVRLKFIGYTSNKRLSRRTAMVYGDDIGLSTARARRAMQAIKEQMQLSDKQVAFEGHGYVQSHDVVNTGFVELDRSKVEVQVVYDELAVLDEMEGVSIKRMTRDVQTRNAFALNLMRISVDGQPINDPNKNIPDVQRCTDVALDKAQVRFKFDNLNVKPRLNIAAWPNVISFYDNADTEFRENLVSFKSYSNYPWSIAKAEVRLFKESQSTRDTPIAIVPMNAKGRADWQYNLDSYSAPHMQIKFVLRVYDKQGNFDETAEQTLWVVDSLQENNSEHDPEKELLVGYGENRLALNHIPLHGGAVSVYGEQVPEGQQVWFAGRQLPVSEDGKFGGEFILPPGLHTVEVAITNAEGNGNVYQRDLELPSSDWFYVGIADLTASMDRTNGPAALITQDDTHYNDELSVDGRLAFYVKGKFTNQAELTTSADTREGPVDELFSNFLNKSPDALFRRIDPDYFYPTFGDDSTVEEGAPTSGKFYLKYQKDKDYGMWGNFNIAYTQNDLAHVDRGLYGANVNYESAAATGFGEKRYAINAFTAEPGTIAGRDEFLGTGGSLYYLKHQDILTGSEQVRIEIRDAVSGLVTDVKNLSHGLDYDIDYIQGRIMLTSPLASSASSGTLVSSGDYGGSDMVLVVRYEYTPGFDDLNDVVKGGMAHYWFNDQVKLGLTMENQDVTGDATHLNAYDLTWRKNAGTWFKVQQSTSQGPVSSTMSSSDGGYNFNQSALASGTDVSAKGQRLDGSVRLQDVYDGINGTFTFFTQQLDAGYAAPGLIALTDTAQYGYTLKMPVTKEVNVQLKGDAKQQQESLKSEARELDVDYLYNDNLTLSAGVRTDKRRDNSLVVPLTQQQGERTDLALRATFDSRTNWLTYGFLQDTTSTTGNRDENNRYGIGGDYRITDRFKLDGELSAGDMGTGAKLGTQYKLSDATDLYSSYALENERSDNGVKARKGNFISGFKSRYSDSANIYMEERYTHGDVPTGLTHSMGFDLAVSKALNFGANLDAGTLRDNNSGTQTDRLAAGVKVGYKFESITYAGALEYRVDDTQQADTSTAERKSWLLKNSLKYQWNEDWRIIAKLNYAKSESSLGDFYNGSFTEAVIGYAFRPVSNDALNMLFKYTYFYNLPAADQVSSGNTTAEYIQKSQILSVDTTYDLNTSWTIGGKYAYRLGQLSLDRENPQFFDSNASLYIVRLDWHFTYQWDALMEGRMLDLPDAGDRRSGLLFAVYRHFDNYLKLGVGYNFTDFSDDLTDLSYDSQGVFVNVVGKF